ncbi:MAG: hypothetical protein NZ937_09565 [Armatimonadetes bacterium]|nr:hypothetical protein [Armatimonadota bacterium]
MTNLRAPNLFGEKIPPSEDGTQKIRQRLWAKAHSMVGKMVTNNIRNKERSRFSFKKCLAHTPTFNLRL